MLRKEVNIIIMEAFYKTYKPAWRSFYKLLFLALIILVLAGLVNYFKPGEAWVKWVWIAAIIVDACIILYITAKRLTMSLILRDNPEKVEDQEIAFIECNPLKPFSSDFRKSIEIGLSNIVHIEIKQSMMQMLMRVGNVIVTSSGTGTEEIKAPNIPNPQAVCDEIQLHARRYAKSAEA